MVKFNLLFNFHLQFTNKSVGSLCFKYENNEIDHPHTAMAYTMAHPMAHPMAYPIFCPYPGKNNRTTKNPEQPGTTKKFTSSCRWFPGVEGKNKSEGNLWGLSTFFIIFTASRRRIVIIFDQMFENYFNRTRCYEPTAAAFGCLFNEPFPSIDLEILLILINLI